ncbi:hypothetical protein DKX38_013684 [Salix brachista]|uniref:Homeobox domain-containing protein n=1 Tax=Salix brachista TaxID=2182728 RepID=A0A5N5LDR3_9ROSI|nr:hypothetical protein DKX38_013684 [Salix brachista]
MNPNMIFFNPSSSTTASSNVLKTGKLPHAPPQNHHFVGIPLAASSSNITSLTPNSNSRRPPLDGVVPSHVHYSIWGSIDQNSFATACESSAASVVGSPQVGFRRPVEQRYRQYHHQMQVVVSSFEQAAGFGAAKSYTALALQTISKQFRSLKNTICSQIRAASKSLGEEDCVGTKAEGSRLRHVDHQLRQHNDWRPQRGLPERAVSVLRAWLFEHFLHPYPKDSDKHMLAKQTGLTRSQVSNWFINARVRLWKPMVEEMYVEEIKEQDSSEENASKKEKIDSGSHSTAPGESSSLQMDQLKGVLHSKQLKKPSNQNASPVKFSYPTISMTMGAPLQQQAGFTFIGPAEMEGISRRSSTEPSSEMQNPPSSNGHGRETRLIKDGYPLIASSGGFGAYPMGDLGRFNLEQLTPRFSPDGVSLTVGLPHCENLSLPGSEQNYLSNQNIQLGGRRRLEIGSGTEPGFSGIITSQNSHSSSGFESIDIQNRTRLPRSCAAREHLIR